MSDKIQKVRTKLLELGYINNEWLAKYLDMLELNLATPKSHKSTQAHHAIPVNSYWTSEEPYNRREAEKLSRADKDNFEVYLLYKDHLLIHSYLTLCTDLNEAQKRYETQADLRKRNGKIAANALSKNKLIMPMPKYITEEKIVAKITLYEAELEKAKLSADTKAEHRYRTLVAQWKSKHRQYLEDPNKYSTRKVIATRCYDEQYHTKALKIRELRQQITNLHKNYVDLCNKFSNIYQAKKNPEVILAHQLWKQAVKDYNSLMNIK